MAFLRSVPSWFILRECQADVRLAILTRDFFAGNIHHQAISHGNPPIPSHRIAYLDAQRLILPRAMERSGHLESRALWPINPRNPSLG